MALSSSFRLFQWFRSLVLSLDLLAHLLPILKYPAQDIRKSLPVDPAEYPARVARQWIPPSIPPEQPASASCRVSQSSSPVDPAKYPARVARQWISPSIPPEQPASASRVSRSSSPVHPAEYPAECPLPVDPAEYPASIEPERVAKWIPPVSRQSSSPVWCCLMSRPANSWVYISCWCLFVF